MKKIYDYLKRLLIKKINYYKIYNNLKTIKNKSGHLNVNKTIKIKNGNMNIIYG